MTSCDAGGCVIVDSTRKGRSLPDAFSRTVPIWCCCINWIASRLREGVSLEDLRLNPPSPDDLDLVMGPNVVPPTELSRVRGLLPSRIGALLDSGLELDMLTLLRKPMRLLWVTPASQLYDVIPEDEELDFYPVVLLVASRAVDVEDSNGFVYVQGAADDEELWSGGLTADAFWDQIRMTSCPHVPLSEQKAAVRLFEPLAAEADESGRGREDPSYVGFAAAAGVDVPYQLYLGLERRADVIVDCSPAGVDLSIRGPLVRCDVSTELGAYDCAPPPAFKAPPSPCPDDQAPPLSNTCPPRMLTHVLTLSLPRGKKHRHELEAAFPALLHLLLPCLKMGQTVAFADGSESHDRYHWSLHVSQLTSPTHLC